MGAIPVSNERSFFKYVPEEHPLVTSANHVDAACSVATKNSQRVSLRVAKNYEHAASDR